VSACDRRYVALLLQCHLLMAFDRLGARTAERWAYRLTANMGRA
jgi:hypothetical protein